MFIPVSIYTSFSKEAQKDLNCIPEISFQCFSTLLLEGNPIAFTDFYLVHFTLTLFNPLCYDIYAYKI